MGKWPLALSNVTVEQFRSAREFVDVATLTAHFNVGIRTLA
jgi:hypothetical protein